MIIARSENDYISVATDCIICNRRIILPIIHAPQETMFCDECKKRLREVLYNIGELENLEEDCK